MSRLACISILEAGEFVTDSGTVTVPTGDVPFPISALLPASAAGASVARGVPLASIGRAAASRGAAAARAVGSSTHAARGSSAGAARGTAQGVTYDPLDLYTTGLTGAWSMGRRLITAYGAGSLFTNTSGFVSVLNDQTGNARNFTSAAGARPTVTTAGPLSRQAADFVSSSILTAAALSNFIANNNGFIVLVCQIDAYTNANNRPLLDVTNDNININITAGGQTPLAKNNDGSSDFAAAASTMSTAAPHVITWRHGGGSLFCSLDGGAEGSAASGNTSSLTGLLQLSSSSSSWFDGKIYELYTWNVAPSSGNRAAIIARAKTYAGVP